MNWRTFWKAVDRFGDLGAPRCEWRWALGDEFAGFEPLLKAHGRTLAGSIHDPDDPSQPMEIFEHSDARYDAQSIEIPPHRKPLVLSRAELVMLIINVPAAAKALAPEMGLAPGQYHSRCPAGLHEMGMYSLPGRQAQPVLLLLPNGGHRGAQLREALRNVEESILLVTSRRGLDETAIHLARECNVVVRSLDCDPGHLLAGISPSATAANGIKPVFSPQPGWTWKMLEIDFSHERFVATIAGQKTEGRWGHHGVRTLHNGQFTDFLNLLIQLARHEPIKQGRSAATIRKRVSRFRETLRALFPLSGEPIAAGVATFAVSSSLTSRKVAAHSS